MGAPSALGAAGVALTPTPGVSPIGRKESKPSLVLLSRGEHSSPGTRRLLFCCLRYPVTGVEVPSSSAHSCSSNSFSSVGAALALGTGGRAGRSEGRGRPTSRLSRAMPDALPTLSRPKYCHFPETSRAQLSNQQGRGDGSWAREAYGEKGILRKYIGPGRCEYCSFSVCSLMDQTFFFFFAYLCSFLGENPPVLSFSRDTSEGKENGDMGSGGKGAKSKNKGNKSTRSDRNR